MSKPLQQTFILSLSLMLLWDKGWAIYVTNFWLSLEGQIKVIDTKYVVLQKLTFLSSNILRRAQKFEIVAHFFYVAKAVTK